MWDITKLNRWKTFCVNTKYIILSKPAKYILDTEDTRGEKDTQLPQCSFIWSTLCKEGSKLLDNIHIYNILIRMSRVVRLGEIPSTGYFLLVEDVGRNLAQVASFRLWLLSLKFFENQIMRKNCMSWREWGNTSAVCTHTLNFILCTLSITSTYNLSDNEK